MEDRIEGLETLLATEMAGLKSLQKGLDRLKRPESHVSERKRASALEKIRDAIVTGPIAEARDALVKAEEAQSKRRQRAARMALLGTLRQLAQADGVEIERLDDSPPTFLMAPITVEMDFEAGNARVLYAREVVARSEIVAQSIMKARQDAIDAILSAALPSGDFFEHLGRAYRMVLAVRGGAEGDRVDLVDLRVPLAALREGVDAWRGLDKIEAVPRYLLAYQLSRLRRDGMLERGGERVDLGVATGGSTKDKRDVLFVPSSASEGQYYLSIRMEARS